MAKSPEEMADAMIQNLKEKTGKDLQQWIKLAKASKLTGHKALVDHLKKEHGVTHGYATLIAHKTLKSDAGSQGSGEDLVAAQYSGPKAELRPIYDRLVSMVKKFGKDVEIAPKKAYVSIRRNKQFALIQPSTKTRVDVGINLKDVNADGRLEASGSFNAMVSHRVRIENKSEVDDELQSWLKKAYDSA